MIQKRNVLDKIEKCGTECHYFPNSMKVCMKYLGYPQFDYAYISGMSGAAFSATWKDMRDCPCDITQYALEWEEPISRAFEACGYKHKLFTAKNRNEAEEIYKDIIVESINKGLPVIAAGVMGPPTFGVIAGYDNFGDTLIGTNFFHNFFNHTPDSEFPHLYAQDKNDWNLEMPAIIVFDEKISEPNISQLYKNALSWAITVNEMEKLLNHPELYCGNTALQKAAADMLDDKYFPMDNNRDALYCGLDAFGGLITNMYGRYETGLFLRRAKEYFPDAVEDLEKAAVLHDIIWNEMTRNIYCPDPNDETILTYAQDDTRKKNSDLLLKIVEIELEANKYIKNAVL